MRFAGLFSKKEPGVAISAMAHAAVLVAGLVAFGANPPPFKDAEEAIAVEVVDPSVLNEVTRGERTAKAVQDAPKPRAERQSEIAEQKDPGEDKRDAPTPPTRPADMKAADRDEAAAPPPAPPQRPQPVRQAARQEPEKAEPKPTEPKPSEAKKAESKPREAAKPEPKPELRRDQLAALSEQAELQAQRERAAEEQRAAAKAREEAEAQAKARAEAQAKARAEAQAKAKADAEAKAQAQAKEQAAAQAKAEAAAEAKEQAEADAKAKADAAAKAKIAADAKAKADAEAKARRDAQVAARFNPNDISKLLASKEPAQSSGSTAREVNRVASLGTQTGSAQRMNPNMRSQLIGLIKEQMERCWNVPVALQGAQRPPVPSVRLALNQDGSLAGQPSVVNASSDPLFRVAADSALSTARRCRLAIPSQYAPFYSDWRDVVVNFDARDAL